MLEVKTGFLGLGEHLYLPLSAVQHVTEGRVRLRQTRRALEAEHPDWHEKPPDLGVRPDEAAPGRRMEPRDIDLGRLFWLVSEAVIAADVQTARIRLWNPGAEAVFGYTAEEIVGQPIELLVPARLLPRHRAGFGRYRATGHGAIVDAGAPVELPALRKDGREITIELSLNAGAGAADERFVLAVVRDVSERKRAEEDRVRLAAEQAARQLAQEQAAAYATLNTALRELAEEREAALRARDEFLSAAAHDLKTPLTTVRAGAQLLRRLVARGADPERLAQSAAGLEQAAARAARQVDALLDLARAAAGRAPALDRRPTDLVALAERAVAEHRQTTEDHRIRVAAAVPELVGSWDAARLARVLDNLLANAAKYSPDGGEITVAVGREEAAAGAWAVLAVRDEGVGIPAADLPRVFERFHRGANVADRVAGTGLGLASARALVAWHGGTIAVQSQEGAGSTFTVRLPLAPPAGAPGRGER